MCVFQKTLPRITTNFSQMGVDVITILNYNTTKLLFNHHLNKCQRKRITIG